MKNTTKERQVKILNKLSQRQVGTKIRREQISVPLSQIYQWIIYSPSQNSILACCCYPLRGFSFSLFRTPNTRAACIKINKEITLRGCSLALDCQMIVLVQRTSVIFWHYIILSQWRDVKPPPHPTCVYPPREMAETERDRATFQTSNAFQEHITTYK